MVQIELEYLKSFAVDGQLSCWGRGQGAVNWSVDNQVVIVHKKGVNIYECCQTPGIPGTPSILSVIPSEIEGPGSIYVPKTASVTAADVMTSMKKQIVFELMRDPILRPHSFDSTLFINYYIKAEWSTVPVYRGLNSECRCILAILTSSHQLLIHGKTNRRYSSNDEWEEPWELLIDLTKVYNRFLLDSWDITSGTDTQFNQYKKRLYELAIVDFIWIPDCRSFKCNDSTKGVFRTHLMTFHANGDVCIWRIKVSKVTKPEYFTRVMYKTNLISDDVFSTVAYSSVSETLGVLVVGTNKGKLRAYRVEKCKRLKAELEELSEEESRPFQKYVIHELAENLWDEEDMLRIESIVLKPESSGRTKLSVVAVKHPNILIPRNLTVLYHKILSEECSVLKVPNGPIVGLTNNRDGFLMTAHESGVLSLISWNHGTLEYIPESRHLLFDPQIVKKRKCTDYGVVQKMERPKRKAIKRKEKRLTFQGLGLSSNRSMLVIARTIGMYYDHLKIRRPTQIVFYSLLPQDFTCAWTSILELYAHNDYSLRRISDALTAFRSALLGNNGDAIYDVILNKWAAPLKDKSTAELKLLRWCLKARPLSSKFEWDVAKAERKHSIAYMRRLAAIDALHKYRVDVVIDIIMQRRCASLIKAVLEHQEESSFSLDSETHKQSLTAMYKFLLSKPDPVSLPPKPKFVPPPPFSTCYWCKGPVEFPLKKLDYSYECKEVIKEFRTKFDSEKIRGFKWKSRRHPVKNFGVHIPEICILSLLPVKLPYRTCQNCLVVCNMEPVFDQQPYCPLCDSYMYPSHEPTSDIPEAIEHFDDEYGLEENFMEIPNPLTLPHLELAEGFYPGVSVKEEPEDFPDRFDCEEEQLIDFSKLPQLKNEVMETCVSTSVDLDKWTEEVSSNEEDSDSSSISDGEDNSSSTNDDEESRNAPNRSESSSDSDSTSNSESLYYIVSSSDELSEASESIGGNEANEGDADNT